MIASLAICLSAFLVQTISGQCIGAAPALPLSSSSCGNNLGLGFNNANVATSGGAFSVTSSSPIAPTGITVVSENNFEGPLAVNGQLPLLAAVFVEGEVPSSGAGAISYSCGSENVGIVSEGNAGVGPAYGNGLAGPASANGLAGPAYANGLAGPAYANGLAGPAYANGLAAPAYGNGVVGPNGRGVPAGYGLPAGPRGCSGGY